MTGLEPHPVLPELTRELALSLGPDRSQQFVNRRKLALEAELHSPFEHGWESPIWGVVDDLLVDGKEVILLGVPGLRIPEDFRREEERRRARGLEGPLTIIGAPEIWIGGSNRSSKSEYAGKKIWKILESADDQRTWCFADTERISIARQQPILWRYLPSRLRQAMRSPAGKIKGGEKLSIGYRQATGFTGQTFVTDRGSQNWFNNYAMDIANMEGDQLDGIWLDELRDVALLKTLRVRLGDRGGLLLVTFTSIDENYSAIVSEYETGMRTVLEVEAELLPIRKRINKMSESVRRSPSLRPDEARRGNSPNKAACPNQQDLRAGQNNLPVPVLAESRPSFMVAIDGEARESTRVSAGGSSPVTDDEPKKFDSRGGQNLSEEEIVGYEKVPRVAIAGPGSDGDQRANIVYFHITDNPFYGFTAKPKPGAIVRYGRERFYAQFRKAIRSKILSRVYGRLTRSAVQQFRFNAAVHTIALARVPREGTRYLIVDPCPGRNWFMIWVLIDPIGRWFIYREFPSHGHAEAYIEGIGDPGPWALAGGRSLGAGRIVHDGSRGAAQSPFQWGYERYREEILRLEAGEPIAERWIDSRYAGSPMVAKEEATTMIRELDKCGLYFRAAPSEQNMLTKDDGSIPKINGMLAYDEETELGKYSARLARLNEPMLFVAETCPNVMFALKEWTGKDGQHGACKDPADCLRYAVLAELGYIGPGAFKWKGGGTY